MARKTSPLEDVFEISAALPWQFGVGLAIFSYFLIHHFAIDPAAMPVVDMLNPAGAAGRILGGTIAYYGQYIVPGILLCGAIASAFKRWRRGKLHAGVVAKPSRNTLERMSWQDFERLVGETFRRRGFQVEERGGAGPDGGVDLALHLGSDSYLVQCKQWKSRSVGVATVRELFGVMAAEGAVGGFVVASGDFTDEARRFAEGRSIELVNTKTLLALVEQTGAVGSRDAVGKPESEPAIACPQCGAAMVRRTAKRGGNAGQSFWGCSHYPACRGTLAG